MKLIQKTESILVAENISEGYSDIGSIINWDLYGPKFIGSVYKFMDWKCLRQIIGVLVYDIVGNDFANWDLLTSEEKKIACKYLTNKIPPLLFVTSVPTAEIRLEISSFFDNSSKSARMLRFERGRLEIFGNFAANDCYWVLDKICPDIELRYYGGIEKLSDDGYFGLLDWVNVDLRNSGKVPNSGLSLDTVCDNILDILENGNY